MGGRFGKYGDAKRKAKIRKSGIVRKNRYKLKRTSGKMRRIRKPSPATKSSR